MLGKPAAESGVCVVGSVCPVLGGPLFWRAERVRLIAACGGTCLQDTLTWCGGCACGPSGPSPFSSAA